MITTNGFADILELARNGVRTTSTWMFQSPPKPTPAAPQDCRAEVAERVAPDGSVITALNEQQVRDAVGFLRGKGVEAIAICMMNSYANSDHERRAGEIVKSLWLEAYVCSSADILPEFREYERFSTTVVNASLMPIMDRYLERFTRGISGLNEKNALRVMQSNGGAVSPNAVRRAPVNTFFSGPAGGIIGCVGIGADLGLGFYSIVGLRCLTFGRCVHFSEGISALYRDWRIRKKMPTGDGWYLKRWWRERNCLQTTNDKAGRGRVGWR